MLPRAEAKTSLEATGGGAADGRPRAPDTGFHALTLRGRSTQRTISEAQPELPPAWLSCQRDLGLGNGLEELQGHAGHSPRGQQRMGLSATRGPVWPLGCLSHHRPRRGRDSRRPQPDTSFHPRETLRRRADAPSLLRWRRLVPFAARSGQEQGNLDASSFFAPCTQGPQVTLSRGAWQGDPRAALTVQ